MLLVVPYNANDHSLPLWRGLRMAARVILFITGPVAYSPVVLGRLALLTRLEREGVTPRAVKLLFCFAVGLAPLVLLAAPMLFACAGVIWLTVVVLQWKFASPMPGVRENVAAFNA